jgi:hypothetical protein
VENSRTLLFVRWIHTLIYVAMVVAIAVLLHAGITGHSGTALWVSLGLLGAESAVFALNGMRCPLTALAVRYGAEKGYAFDTLLPERFTRCTFRFFGTLTAVGLALLVLRWTGVLP